MHETAVSWLRHRLSRSTPPKCWQESREEYGRRLKRMAAATDDVEGDGDGGDVHGDGGGGDGGDVGDGDGGVGDGDDDDVDDGQRRRRRQ